MSRTKLESYFAVFLFIAVVIAFSFAEEQSKKIKRLYTTTAKPLTDSPVALKPGLLPYTP